MRTADTFLPISRLQGEIIRVEGGVTEADSLLQGARDSAISWLTKQIGMPVVDRAEAVFRQAIPTGTDRLVVCRPYARELTAIRYWAPSTGQDEAPDGSVMPLPRAVPLPDGGGLQVFAPAGGWPEMASEGGLWAVITAGLPEEHEDAGTVRQAAICAARLFFNGAREIRETDAAHQLISPVADWLGGRERYDGGWDGWIPDAGDGETLTYGGEPVTLGGVRLSY